MLEYVLAAWLTGCAGLPYEVLCGRLEPGGIFAIAGPVTWDNGDRKPQKITPFCVKNTGEISALVGLKVAEGRTTVLMSPGIVRCEPGEVVPTS